MFGIVKHVYTLTQADEVATTRVRPSDWNTAHNETALIGGNTLGGSSVFGTAIVLEAGSNVTLSADQANTKVVIVGPQQTVQAMTAFLSGNTAGSSVLTGDPIVLAGGNNVTLSASQNSLTIVGPTVPAQTDQTIGAYAVGNTTAQSSSGTLDARSVSLDGAGLVSVGLSGGSIVISATAPAQTVQNESLSISGNTVGTSSITGAPGIVIAGGNNITLSGSGATIIISGPNTVAQSNQTEGFYAVGNTTGQSSSSTLDARTHSISGAGGVSVGYSAGAVVVSGPQTVAQTNQTVGVYASSQTVGQSSSSTVDARSFTHVGQGIVSVGMSAGSLLISATTPSQTAQTLGLYGISNTTGQSSSTTVDARSLSIEGAGAVSVGMSGGSLVISAAAGGQSAQTLGVYASSQTVGQSSSSTVDARSFTHVGQGIVSVGMSGGSLLISATTPAQSIQTVGLYAIGQTTGQSSSSTFDARSISIEGDGMIRVGESAGVFQISATQSAQTVGLYGVGNTSGTSSSTVDARSLSLAGSGNISVGWSAGQFFVSGSQSAQTGGVYAQGNTTGQSSSSTFDARSLSVQASGNISAGWSGGSLVLSVAPGGGGNATLSEFALGNTTVNSSTSADARSFSVAGAGIVSVGYSSNSGLIVSATVAAQSNQTEGIYAVGNTTGQSSSSTFDARTVSFDGAGGVSVGMSGGSVVISGPQTVAQTVQTEGFYAVGNTTGQSSSTTLDARTHSIDGAGGVSVGYSGGSIVISGPQTVAQTAQTIGVYASSQTVGQSSSSTIDARSFTHVGQGIVSVGMSGGSLLISATTSSQSNQTIGVYASSQTVGQSSSSTVDARSFTHVGQGIVSVGMSGGSLLISATTAQSNQTEGLYAVGNTTGQSSSTTVDARTLSIQGAGIASVGYSAGSLIVSVPAGGGAAGTNTLGMSNLGNTAGTSGVITGSGLQEIIVGGNNITVSQSVNGASATLSLVAPASSSLFGGIGVGLSSAGSTISIYNDVTVSNFEPYQFGNNSSMLSVGQSTLMLEPIVIGNNGSFCRMNRVVSISVPANITFGTNSTGSWSNSWGYTETVGLYSRGTGASSTALMSASSTSWSMGLSQSVAVATGGATTITGTVTASFGFISQIDTAGGFTSGTFSSTSSRSSAAASTTLTNPVTGISGVVLMPVPFGMSMTPGEWYVGFLGASSSTSAGRNVTQMSLSMGVLSGYTSNHKFLGQTATATSNRMIEGDGIWNAQVGALTSPLALSSINNQSNLSMYFNMLNVSL